MNIYEKTTIEELFEASGDVLDNLIALSNYCTYKKLSKSWRIINRKIDNLLSCRTIINDYAFSFLEDK